MRQTTHMLARLDGAMSTTPSNSGIDVHDGASNVLNMHVGYPLTATKSVDAHECVPHPRRSSEVRWHVANNSTEACFVWSNIASAPLLTRRGILRGTHVPRA